MQSRLRYSWVSAGRAPGCCRYPASATSTAALAYCVNIAEGAESPTNKPGFGHACSAAARRRRGRRKAPRRSATPGPPDRRQRHDAVTIRQGHQHLCFSRCHWHRALKETQEACAMRFARFWAGSQAILALVTVPDTDRLRLPLREIIKRLGGARRAGARGRS